MSSPRPAAHTPARVRTFEDGRVRARSDAVATEEPLEIRLHGHGVLAVTMRTPGSDFELAAGFLYGEGVLSEPDEVSEIRYCTDVDVPDAQRYNVVTVHLRPGTEVDLRPLERHFHTTSACGVCGKASLESLRLDGCPPAAEGPALDPEVLYGLPEQLRSRQGVFERTGGLHAAGLFDADGRLLALREDVGRHNAVDKLVGWALLERRLPLREHVLVVSGRASFEIMQKALRAGIPVVCAVSAPSSLAVDVAREFEMTLVGFLRDRRFNVYADPGRLSSRR